MVPARGPGGPGRRRRGRGANGFALSGPADGRP